MEAAVQWAVQRLGVREVLERYAAPAGTERSISPHRMRHSPLTWLKTQGIDDAPIRSSSGYVARPSLAVGPRPSAMVRTG